MTTRPTVAAIFATMNRSQTAVACVQALAAQTCPPSWVVVADNDSTDDTLAALESLTDLPFELVIHRMQENRGNAGVVEEAMAVAFTRGADAVWILDDDSWPRPTALAALRAAPWDPRVVRHPLQLDPRTGRFTWPLQVADGHGAWRLVDTLADLPAGDSVVTRITWTGALVSREVRDAVGPVNGELFIRGEDEEYPWRIEQAGFSQAAMTRSILDHPGPANIVHWQIGRKNFFYERGLNDWKLYYKVRNMVWLKRQQNGARAAIAMVVTYALAAAWLDGPRRVSLICRAARDGWRSQLGKWPEQRDEG